MHAAAASPPVTPATVVQVASDFSTDAFTRNAGGLIDRVTLLLDRVRRLRFERTAAAPR